MRPPLSTAVAAIALFATGAAAQPPTAVPMTAAAAPPVDPQVETLRQQLLSYRQEIARLRGELAAQQTRTATLDRCEAKNGRLVAIGNELIAAYGKRYDRAAFVPFESGRRKFEAELQGYGDRIYENGKDVPVKPLTVPTGAADAPAVPTKQ